MSDADRVKWDGIYARGRSESPPSPFLVSVEGLPRSGRALDLAGGAGRNALFLAERGLHVTIADVSAAGLEIATRLAAERGLSERVATLQVDLEEEGPPPGPWDVVIDFNYLQRSLFAQLPALLAPGGWFVFLQPTQRNLERNPRPSSRFLLEDGELPGLLPDGLDVIRIEEGWVSDRHSARLVACRME
jgi:SAM-dependent methyltransferase